MGTIVAEGRSLGSNLIADIRTAILTSSDWARPNAGARPDTLKTTTTRGAQMVIDLQDAAMTPNIIQIGCYDAYDGATLGNKKVLYLLPKRANTGTLATNYYYWFVTAGKDHIFLTVGGPLAGDPAGVDGTYGGNRQYFFANELTPYYDNTLDPVPCYIAGSSSGNNNFAWDSIQQDGKAFCSKAVNGTPWSGGKLLTLTTPGMVTQPNRKGLDGKLVLPVYTYNDEYDGQRGRLKDIYHAGGNAYSDDGTTDVGVGVGQELTIDGRTFRVIQPNRGGAEDLTNYNHHGPLGVHVGNNGQQGNANRVPLVAVPTT